MRLIRIVALPLLALAMSAYPDMRPHQNASPQPAPPVFEMARGADIGWLSQTESSGRVLKDSKGNTTNGLDLLKGEGVNSVRLRVWVNPANAWCGKADVVKMAKRAQAKGFRIMIDFHYSDSWADPGQQTKPAAWSSHSIEQLKTDVSTHTTEVLMALKDSGVVPEWVQVGNETNDGMLWEEGRASKNMANFAALVQSGSKATKAVFPNAKVVVHISNGWDNSLFRWIFDGLRNNAVEWDVVGMSLYPDTLGWRATETQCASNMRDMVSRYGKSVMISEVGLEWWAVDSSYALLHKLTADVASLGSNGLGVFYWEPLSPPGWNGYQKGATDNSGKLTKALDVFLEMAAPLSVSGRSMPSPRLLGPVHDALGRVRDGEPTSGLAVMPTSLQGP